jgi:hypothetical protein
MASALALAMAGAASAHQAATASREQNSQQRAGRTRRTSADLQRAPQGKTAAAVDAPAALDSLSRLQRLADASPQVAQLRRLQALADDQFAPVSQLAGDPDEEELIQGKFATAELPAQLQQSPRANNTGLPDQLKSGIESLSGLSMDHVRVHYNSSQPAQLNALAYAQGRDIHLAPGQERHLPHEAWHVVQQAQGRVQPTMQMAGGVNVNDDTALENEADVMGAKAITHNGESSLEVQQTRVEGSLIQRELMTEDEFENISGSFFSGSRNRVLRVDEALKKCQDASSKSVALTELIGACNEYLNIPEQKASKRISGVEALLKNATEELAAWRLRERIPLPNAVYRMDERPPAEIANVGFQPWNAGGDISIIEHVNQVLQVDRGDAPTGESGEAGKGAKKHSQWVSTSGDLNFAKDPTLLQGLLFKYFYKIDTSVDPLTFTDVNKHFDEQGVPNPYEPQFEFIKSGGIPGNQVTYYVHGKELMEFVIARTDASSWNIPWTPMPNPD